MSLLVGLKKAKPKANYLIICEIVFQLESSQSPHTSAKAMLFAR